MGKPSTRRSSTKTIQSWPKPTCPRGLDLGGFASIQRELTILPIHPPLLSAAHAPGAFFGAKHDQRFDDHPACDWPDFDWQGGGEEWQAPARKDDEFTITTQVQQRGQWVLHPLDEALRQSQADAFTVGGIKEGAEPSDSQSESIPARSAKRTLKDKMGLQVKRLQHEHSTAQAAQHPSARLFNDPDLNLRANYCMFDRSTARPVCVGDGESCKRVTDQGLETMECPGPDAAVLLGNCKPYGG
jgi:hypothetical protein